MYISKLEIKNFRTFNANGISIYLNDGINILVGENNVGKSTIIDALRLVATSLQYKRDIYIKKDDFHIDEFGNQANKITIKIRFSGLSEEQQTSFFELIDENDTMSASLCICYFLQKNKKGYDKVVEKIGKNEDLASIDRETLDNINLLYLPALRDVETSLKPSQKSSLAEILKKVITAEQDKKDLIEELSTANKRIIQNQKVKSIEKKLNSNLVAIENDYLSQKVLINLLEPTFESISGSLGLTYIFNHNKRKIPKKEFLNILEMLNIELEAIKDKIKEHEDCYEIELSSIEELGDYEDLYNEIITNNKFNFSLNRNGLGYNNLLAMATSVTNLQENLDLGEFSLFLIEEPEAHLHPQLLDLVLDYFSNNIKDNTQVIITSHSPVLTSNAKLDEIILIRNDEFGSYSTSLKNTNLDDIEKKSLERYMDVTKSQFLFSKGVIFVEGISEALLINEFSKILSKPLNKYSIEIVNINGVDFNPFVKLFKKDPENNDKDYIKAKISIISDDDRCTNEDDENKIIDDDLKGEILYDNLLQKLINGNLSNRAVKLRECVSENISVNLAFKTFEYELAKKAENNDILLRALSKVHPNIAKEIQTKIDERESQDLIALRIWKAIRDCKGSFAQNLAIELIKDSAGFVVPEYIENAINFVIGV